MSDILDEIVADEVDVNLTPELNDGEGTSPLISSGVSSAGSVPAPPTKQPSQKTTRKSGQQGKQQSNQIFNCPQCPKTYKREKGLENHIFVHKIQDASKVKPKTKSVIPLVPEFVLKILKEIQEEPNIPKAKGDFVGAAILASKTSAWDRFIKLLCDLIVASLTKRTKITPTLQYEEFLSQLMSSLNANNTFENIKIALCVALCKDSSDQSEFLEMVVLRLCMRLTEEVQCHIVKEMRQPFLSSATTSASASLSEKEETQLKHHIKNLIQQYFVKVLSLSGPVWRARSLCLRNRFVCNQDGDGVSEKAVMDNTLWNDQSVCLSDNTLNFFYELETLIKSVYSETGKYSYDNITDKILKNGALLDLWNLLVSGYLAEVDSLLFMKEMVNIFVTLSIRLEERRLQLAEHEKSKLAKFSLRGNLQRN